jgi:NAD(P) transhydrogenase subunit beta
MSTNLVTVAYIAASILFILSLGGLSNQETAKRGNLYGIAGMAIAFIATALSAQVSNYGLLMAAILPAILVGALVASRVVMTAMPELVAILHSFVGLAAVLVGLGNYLQPAHGLVGALRPPFTRWKFTSVSLSARSPLPARWWPSVSCRALISSKSVLLTRSAIF